ncbi:MAG: hypothetical protein J2P23_04300 [Microlunatus sp.]|nr:hypothetical protein [Microlunatus sp.]
MTGPVPGGPSDPLPSPELVPVTSTGARRCRAHNRQGEQCSAPAVNGATVCRYHGGATPQVQRKARLRILELVDPAIATLAREMTNSKARPIERVKAAEAILNRAGLSDRNTAVDSDAAREMLRLRLIEIRDEALIEQRQIEGEVVDGDGEPMD